MIRKSHNHKLQTNPWYHEEEQHNNHETQGRQTKQSNQLCQLISFFSTLITPFTLRKVFLGVIWLNYPIIHYITEHSGSKVECLTQDRGAAGSSLTGVTVLWSLSKTHLSLLNTGSTQEDLSRNNWKNVDWDIKNQIKQTNRSTHVRPSSM